MDPLTALSVAGTIVQFADFGTRLFSEGRELYQSATGALTANEELELVTVDLKALVVKLGHSSSSAESTSFQGPDDANNSRNEESFRKICSDVTRLADELLERLDRLKVRGTKKRHWESFQKAIQSAWSKGEITSLTNRLLNLKRAAETHTLFCIREKLDAESLQNSSHFASLDQRTRLIISSILHHHANENVMAAGVRDQMNTLLQLVRRLDTANVEEHRRTREMIVNLEYKQSAQQSSPIETITASIELLSVSDKEERKLRRSVQREIISSLEYPSMTSRYENIVEAYPTTFEWAFHDSTDEQMPWSNLSQWLKTGDGVYWINGKAGSGKSTLMKHIFEQERTRQYLNRWARGSDGFKGKGILICFATFFFWNSGTQEQKSQSGLLRSLLFQVLSHNPELVSIAFPDIWATTYSGLINDTSLEFDHIFTLGRLITAFRAIIHQNSVPMKLCFLVDGLDEFDGSHEEMANLFKDVATAKNVKVCLSSRPWVVFSESFKNCPSLRLQDLTRPDITSYVNGKFGQSEAFCSLLLREPQSAPELLTEIIDKADGVFLWVQIVVNSLLKGVQNRDEITILHQRLRCMPQELEPLYHHLLSLIEPVYKIWASKAFQIIRAYRDCRSDGTIWPPTATEDRSSITISELYFSLAEKLEVLIDDTNETWVQEQIYSRTSQVLTEELLPAKYEDAKIHLTARCAGLLEIPSFERDGPKAAIQFLHRTARDFLENRQNWLEILAYTANTNFDPYASLLKAGAIWLAIRCSQTNTRSVEVCKIMYNTVLYARKTALRATVDDGQSERIAEILQNAIEVMTEWDSIRKSTRKCGKEYRRRHWTCRLIGPTKLPFEWKFVALATVYGLDGYVGEQLRESSREAKSADIASQLLYFLIPGEKWPDDRFIPAARPEMVSLLLSHGADPDFTLGRPPYALSAWLNADLRNEQNSAIIGILDAARRKRRRGVYSNHDDDHPPRKKQH
ncbi:uncharacterized protein PAC_19146 [Phialocephala subalpina]|uniref:Uncharacterized protein n=1 Tax=Phialocephala subalpina TaxID=576137 RepID=A0A1L7XW49_9HELO|nr:uncharacterized protein PAC_19146 [Phialocephala subalpina]